MLKYPLQKSYLNFAEDRFQHVISDLRIIHALQDLLEQIIGGLVKVCTADRNQAFVGILAALDCLNHGTDPYRLQKHHIARYPRSAEP